MNKKTRKKLLKIVRDNYEEIGEEFSDTRNYVWPELKKLVNLWCPTPKTGVSDTTILDVGCGNGRMLGLFKDVKVEYTGVEQSEKLVEIARQRCKEKSSKCQIIKGDILGLNEEWTSVCPLSDLILCIAVLHHIPSRDLRLQFLKKLKDRLKNNGRLIITVWNLRRIKRLLIWKYNLLKLVGLNKMDFNDVLFKGFQRKSWRYYHAFSARELRKLLKDAGWREKKLYADGRNIYAVGKI